MSSYFVAQITIRDQTKYEKYLEGFDALFGKYQGSVIAVDDHPEILEGRWPHGRFVLIRFPNKRELRRWYESSEYQQLARTRQQAADSTILLVGGRD